MSESGTVWSITINNPTDADRSALKTWPSFVKETVYQDEIGENNTLHIQGMVKCKYTVKFQAIKKWLERAHIEKARNSEALKNYVMKAETAVAGTQVSDSVSQNDNKEYVQPSKFPRLVIKHAKRYMEQLDWRVNGEWFDMYEVYDRKHFVDAVIDSTIRQMIREGWHIELLAVNPAIMKALRTYWCDLWEEDWGQPCIGSFDDMMKRGLRPKMQPVIIADGFLSS